MILGILIFLAIIFVIFALWSFYGSTASTDSAFNRFITAIVLAAGSLGAAIASWFQTPPPTP